jgi:hypothetical protein
MATRYFLILQDDGKFECYNMADTAGIVKYDYAMFLTLQYGSIFLNSQYGGYRGNFEFKIRWMIWEV